MNTSNQVHPAVRIPPPLMFVIAFAIGLALDRWIPAHVQAGSLAHDKHVAGLISCGCGVLIALTSVGIFLFSRTTLVPFGTAAKLVTCGPYRLTRNPMYLSLLLVYLGAAGIHGRLGPMIMLPLPLLLLSRWVIPFEERQMRTAFGITYDQYCSKVRRWL